MGRWEDLVSSVYSRLLSLIAFALVIIGLVGYLSQSILLKIEMAGMREAFQLMIHIGALTLIIMVLFAAYQIALSKDIRDISEDVRDILEERLPLPKSDPGEEKRERIETSGAGALVGLALGGIVGLPFGLTGMVVGAILGAVAGNQIEYESLRARREGKRRKLNF